LEADHAVRWTAVDDELWAMLKGVIAANLTDRHGYDPRPSSIYHGDRGADWAETAHRRAVQLEIQESVKPKKVLVGVFIDHPKDQNRRTSFRGSTATARYGVALLTYAWNNDVQRFADAIEAAGSSCGSRNHLTNDSRASLVTHSHDLSH
jgi:hypothetical protein